MSYQEMLNEYSRLIVENNNVKNQQRQEELLQRISQLERILILYRDEQLKNGNAIEDLIMFFAKFDAYEGLSGKATLEKEEEETIVNNSQKYSLASSYIISELTGEKVSLVGFSISSKIELIYQHTGEIISSNDSEIIEKRKASFNAYMKSIKESGNVSRYIEMYGDDWIAEIEKLYNSGYDNAVAYHVQQITDKVNKRNIEYIEELEQELEESEKEKEQLTTEITELKEEVSELINQVAEIKQVRKVDLEDYKKSMQEMVINNSQDKNRTYADGTVRPDINISEYSRYTTKREDRTNETGMQQRVNDSAHVHDELNELEKMILQEKYKRVFGEMPVQEEDKPKSR